jgi:hypothetical protein
MTRRTVLISLAVLGVLGLAVLGTVAGGAGEAQGSSISHGPAGWLAARKYLEARGAQVTLWCEPTERFSGGGVLVVAFPWQNGASAEAAERIEAHLQRGGSVVLAWSGSESNPGEILALHGLGFPLHEVRKQPLRFTAWRKFSREEWDLRPAGDDGSDALGGAPVRIWAPRSMPEIASAEKAEILYRTPTGRPAVVRLRRHRGSLWLLPADALANARLGKAGNADLLETLLVRLGRQWTFDEYHHGLIAAETAEDGTFTHILDLVLLHLALLYVLAVMTLSRRFGPAWREPPVVTGSVASFLLGLGALHHRLSHHGDAARRLLERSRELFPDLPLPAELARRAAAAASPQDLLAVARALVRLRRPLTPGPSPIPSPRPGEGGEGRIPSSGEGRVVAPLSRGLGGDGRGAGGEGPSGAGTSKHSLSDQRSDLSGDRK